VLARQLRERELQLRGIRTEGLGKQS